MNTLLLLAIFLIVFIGVGMVMNSNMMTAMGAAATLVMFLAVPNKMSLVASSAGTSLDTFALLALPFFMIAGTIMEYSGISSSLVGWIDKIIGRIRGSLGAVTVVASMAFGLLTGSAMATISSIGKMMFPELTKRGYRKEYSAALFSATCFLGILIPPSIPGIMYAISANVNVKDVWIATVIPGIMFGASYIAYNAISKKGGYYDKRAKGEHVPFATAAKDFGKSTWSAFPSLLMPIIIFGGIYGGIFTATEAGAVCVVYGIIYFIYKKIRRKGEIQITFTKMMIIGCVGAAGICMIQAMATVANRAISMAGLATALSTFLGTYVHSKIVFLIICNIIFLILGCLIDITSAVVIATPLLLPAAIQYGIDPIHFGNIMLVNLSVGFMTPPMAGGIFVSSKVTGVDFGAIVKEIIPFFLIGIAIIILVTFIPELSLLLVAK